MDSTLSVIILPMLIQLKKTKHGAPRTNDSDVPDHLKSYNAPKPTTEWDVDLFHFDRWNYILDEMIFAFGSSTCDDWKDQYQSGESDFQFIDIGDGVGEMIEGPNHTLVYDWDGLHSHTNRIKNGFRLFGTYYQNLWD
jgi:beta-lactamase superfamily II metal-dependent hydrolase